jgi:maleamate amidohydrolase
MPESDSPVWGKKMGFGQRPALLIVDLTRAFTEAGRPLGSSMPATLEATNALLDCAHKVEIPVIFTTVSYDSNDLSDAGIWITKIGGLEDLKSGSNGVDIAPQLHREERDGLLVKKYASCFFGTDLVSRLLSMGCDTLIMAGCSTSGCIRATAVDAIQYGFRPIVVEDAVADRWPEAHQQSLSDLQAKYADVLPLGEVLAHLETPLNA